MTPPTPGDCGCCGGGSVAAEPANPPGRSTLSYRGGTQTSVLRRMLARLGDELPLLTARSPDDPAIALLDAWATVADVVTFYQERIVTEGFLRTATERASVLELARSIGYELRPGVAAAAHLRFTVESTPGAPPGAVAAERTGVRSVPPQDQASQTFETDAELPALAALNEVGLRTRKPQEVGPGTARLYLAGVTTGLSPGDGILVIRPDRAGTGHHRDFRVLRAVDTLPDSTLVSWDAALAGGSTPPQDQVEVYAFRLRASLFGQNAPDWRVLPDDVRSRYLPAVGDPNKCPTWPGFALPAKGDVLELDAAHPDLGKGSWLVLTQPGLNPGLFQVASAEPAGVEDFGITGRTTRVTLTAATNLSAFDRRDAVVHTRSERLPLVDEPIEQLLSRRTLELDRFVPLAERAVVFLTGTVGPDPGVPYVRLATLGPVRSGAVGTVVTLDADLPQGSRPDSVRLLGNVVPATHGETVEDEVLGSGDGALAHQRFTLRKPDLTHVSARTASGVLSTLEVRVDGVRWTEVASLFLAGPQDRVYVVRLDDDGFASVVFGDGVRGARLPTGQENVRARYRSGIGPAGRVPAESLTLLQQRPLGMAGVSNPLPATGGAAAEQLADARTNAPLTVLTLDRVVSLRDHEDFARAFTGIAKARAVAVPVRGRLLVHLTVAAEGGGRVDDTTVEHLREAIADLGGTPDLLRVDSARTRPFEVGVAVLADPALVRSAVDDGVVAAVRSAFAADRREFGQPVTAAELITTVLAVPGVVAARPTALHLPKETGVQEVLSARDARAAPTRKKPDRILPAELLVVAPDAVDVTAMAP